MSSFYKCSLFLEPKIKQFENFCVKQEEILMNEMLNNERISFIKMLVSYHCSFLKQEDFDPEKPTLLIPIKDNSELLTYTLNNLIENEVSRYTNIIVIDDRSEKSLNNVALEKKISYLRVDTDKGFNFSMLNNIAAKLCFDLGGNEIILWNSDLWTPNKQTIPQLIAKHKKENSKISGTKLLYPPVEMSLDKNIDTKNIKETFPKLTNGKWRETVQFGGDLWTATSGPIRISPGHNKRFSEKSNPLVNCDRGSMFVTGAFQIWDLKYFISLGGLNPSLSKNFQDVDICLRSVEENIYPLYFGKDIFLYHDESLNMHNLTNEKKNDNQMISDYYLFAKLWNEKIPNFVLR